ncbi:HAD family hydrolase [Aquimixticola soesokkakensis]|uniref:HAD family hydrolase n=1 Tax=Aquimixticola soesokkakensis TaxID=1519096 RepID=UPI00190EEE43|nr:HAD family hydrolase [Aquimixticola soesokkakensis]
MIFDCDGVLVDSEPLAIAELRDLLSELGCALSEAEAYDRLLGRSVDTMRATLSQSFGITLSDAHLAQFRGRLFDRLTRDLTAIPGVRDMIARLDVPVCVASSSHPDRIALSLEKTGLADSFGPRVFSATMVKHGKPAPDLFLHAAAQMATPPARCIVVEDSPAGITAARAAGMTVLGFTGGSHALAANLEAQMLDCDTPRPDAICPTMAALEIHLAQWLAPQPNSF